MAKKACHTFASTAQVGLTQALGAMKTYVAALIALLASGNTIACSCKDFTLPQAREVSDVVFVGQVAMLQCSSIPGKTAVNFNVSSAFKGHADQETVVLIESDPHLVATSNHFSSPDPPT